MSRSSTEGSSGPDYYQGWRALYRLIRSGSSFSGHERNCAFLNLGGEGFATVSSASGFDEADDGRALAVVDWDQDGRLDLWTSNRTGPRVRLYRNQVRGADEAGYVALRLRGTHANRDAIGARVELTTSAGKRWKTVRAGGGFLSQSSRWLHFGLAGARLESVRVTWPDGTTEDFQGVRANARFELVEGEGEARQNARASTTPSALPSPTDAGDSGDETLHEDPLLVHADSHARSSPAAEATDPSSRTVLGAPLDLPPIVYRTEESQTDDLASLLGQPILVTFWASWCGICMDELGELAGATKRVRDAGLQVVALNVDEIRMRMIAKRRLAKAGWAYRTGYATEETLDLLEALRMSVLEDYGDSGLPMSLLIDPRGRLVTLYHGRFSLSQVFADVEHLASGDLGAEKTRAAASPFDGRWLGPPPTPAHLSLTGLIKERGYDELARAYVDVLRTSMEE